MATSADADSTVPTSSTGSPVTTYPDDWSDIELIASATEAYPGDTVAVSIICPHRNTSYQAPFEVVHPDLTFAMEDLDAVSPDVYSTSFVVPYWLAPGELELRGGCPRPPGPCDDTSDCREYETDPTPVVTIPLKSDGDGAWDSWRPVAEPYLDPMPEVGATLPGGAIVTASESPFAQLRASVGDRLRVVAQCPPDAASDGARFVILPWRTVAAADPGDEWGWSVTSDPEHRGRYVMSSDLLLTAERVLDEPLPWFVEFAAASATPAESATVVAGEVVFESGLVSVDDGDPTGLYITALCEDVGMPFDPRSIDVQSTAFLIGIGLSE